MNPVLICEDDIPEFVQMCGNTFRDRLKKDKDFAHIMLKIILDNHPDLL